MGPRGKKSRCLTSRSDQATLKVLKSEDPDVEEMPEAPVTSPCTDSTSTSRPGCVPHLKRSPGGRYACPFSALVDVTSLTIKPRSPPTRHSQSRKNVEGTLFVVKRRVEPRFQFVVLNRLSSENCYEDLIGRVRVRALASVPPVPQLPRR